MIVFVLIKNYKKNRKIIPGKETLRIPPAGMGCGSCVAHLLFLLLIITRSEMLVIL